VSFADADEPRQATLHESEPFTRHFVERPGSRLRHHSRHIVTHATLLRKTPTTPTQKRAWVKP
jgi:hypothetical protein